LVLIVRRQSNRNCSLIDSCRMTQNARPLIDQQTTSKLHYYYLCCFASLWLRNADRRVTEPRPARRTSVLFLKSPFSKKTSFNCKLASANCANTQKINHFLNETHKFNLVPIRARRFDGFFSMSPEKLLIRIDKRAFSLSCLSGFFLCSNP